MNVILAYPVGRAIPEPSLEWLKRYAQEQRRPLIFYERMVTDGSFSRLKRFAFGPAEFRQKVMRLGAEEMVPATEMHSG
jgi:hypothetical protein